MRGYQLSELLGLPPGMVDQALGLGGADVVVVHHPPDHGRDQIGTNIDRKSARQRIAVLVQPHLLAPASSASDMGREEVGLPDVRDRTLVDDARPTAVDDGHGLPELPNPPRLVHRNGLGHAHEATTANLDLVPTHVYHHLGVAGHLKQLMAQSRAEAGMDLPRTTHDGDSTALVVLHF